MTGPLRFDDRRRASLDGEWEFFPGPHELADLGGSAGVPIAVPALWETQGHLDLDGVAWYRRRFTLDDVSGGWTLRFGAVMDFADVYLNGRLLGSHDAPFTPFDLDPTALLVPGGNELAVRVFDPSVDDPEHVRMAHGKQGWANHVFPSRPSLYMTYGGIWQTVTLRRHGQVVIGDVFVDADPDDLHVTVELENRSPAEAADARLGVRTLGRAEERAATVPAGERVTVEVALGRTAEARWSPAHPVLHELDLDAWTAAGPSDTANLRYGLRTVRLDGDRMLVNGEPFRMKSVLVQGFRADGLYAEGDEAQMRAEIEAAKAMGFNMLRLHIKAFDPRYLDLCDQIGVLVHSDIPVAEPIVHEEMGDDSTLTRRCVRAAVAQVRRDRNHPSIVLWSAMNEICDGRREARRWPQYESFARTLYAAVRAEDPSRPVIENDWVEPDPGEVYESPILTAHWYGRLHRDYLDKLERQSQRWAGTGRPFFVSEFGDWGLPEMPLLADPPFWDTRAVHAAGLADSLWPATIGRFAIETQRYQGISDRLQAEVFRRHQHIGGYCLTELTDVPFELNGVLDLHRRPKRLAVQEIRRANATVLPMLQLDTLVAAAGQTLRAELHVANDGPALDGVTVEIRFGDAVGAVTIESLLAVDASELPARLVEDRFPEGSAMVQLGDLAGYRAHAGGEVTVTAPDVPGNHDLVLRLSAGGTPVAENRYPVHVVRLAGAAVPVRVLRPGRGEAALAGVGAVPGGVGPLVVPEGALDSPSAAAQVAEALRHGDVVLVLAQERAAAAHYPVPLTLEDLETAWGSTVFRFTTDHGAVPALPRRALLVAEDSTIHAHTVVASVAGRPFPDTPVVIAYKPFPGALTGTVVGSHAVGAGRMVLCQYRLEERALAGDVAARSILADLLRWVAQARPVMVGDRLTKHDGRSLTTYSWHEDVAR
ncbi:MAG: glycoside hydrolase family 2 TIM barrel-domain containing protein [Acidimicrobiia bacterium]